AALPMGAGEATIVLRSTYGASSCDKILKYIPHGPPVKPSSAGAYGPDDTRDPDEKVRRPATKAASPPMRPATAPSSFFCQRTACTDHRQNSDPSEVHPFSPDFPLWLHCAYGERRCRHGGRGVEGRLDSAGTPNGARAVLDTDDIGGLPHLVKHQACLPLLNVFEPTSSSGGLPASTSRTLPKTSIRFPFSAIVASSQPRNAPSEGRQVAGDARALAGFKPS
ncbi:hypothetical protein C8J57DRAFT_1610070, partial [Mycena rebaudengoi]